MNRLAVIALIVVPVALVALVPSADAGCRRVVRHQAVVVAPAVEVVAAVPVVTPVFVAQYQPFAVPSYNVGYGQGDVAPEIRALRQSLEKLAPAAQPAPAAKAPPAAMPRADVGDTNIPDATKVSPAPKVVASACIRCHGATNPRGGVSLAGDVPQLVKLRAFKAVATGRMPPSGPAVSDEDLESLSKWSE